MEQNSKERLNSDLLVLIHPRQTVSSERANRDIRKHICGFMLRDNSMNRKNNLDKVEESKNVAYHSNIKASPDEVWSSNKNPVNELDIPSVITKADKPKIAKAHILHRVMKQFEHEDIYQVGDKSLVRVKMSSIFKSVRKLVKNNATKQIVITYTPAIHRVDRVIIPRRGLLGRKRYILIKEDGGPIRSSKGRTKDFNASELISATDATPVSHITMAQALKLN